MKKSQKQWKIRISNFVSEDQTKRPMAFGCEKTTTICFDIFFFMNLKILDTEWFVNEYIRVNVAD
jgi:hypothetical protein